MSPNDNKKELVKAGEVLVVQGKVPGDMYYLHSGAAEILSAAKEFEGLDPAIIASKSRRVGLIKEGILIPPMNILFADPSTKSVRVIQDSYVSRFPLNQGGITQIAKEDPSWTASMLSHLFKMLDSSMADDSRYTRLYTHLCKINDNISLLYQCFPKADVPEKLKNKSEGLFNAFRSNKGDFPKIIEAQFLISDNSGFIRKKYAFPGMPIQSIVDQKQCAHVKKFLQLDKNTFGNLIKEDPSILQNMIETISDNLIKVLDRIYSVHIEIDSELDTLFGPKSSWSSFLTDNNGFDLWLGSGRLAPNFINNFLALIKKLHSYYFELTGKKLIELFPGPKRIHEYYVAGKSGLKKTQSNPDEEKPGHGNKDTGTSRKAHSGVYRNSIHQIFEFALIDKEFQKGFIKTLNDFKNMNNPFNTEIEGRKIRRSITKYYWDLFIQVFIRKQKEPAAPLPVKLMMKFGFLDETLVEEQQLEELNGIVNINEEIKDIPILFEEEFLTRVYSGKENPSITEMGLSYEAFKREEGKHKSSKDMRGAVAGGDNINKTIYEIEHRLLQTTGVCTGSTATAFPILTSMIMRMNPKNIFMSKSKISSVVKELMSIDFSVFYRETTLKLGDARELIQEEILPVFILLPSFGTKTMLWQDLDGSNRKTRGRIVIPIFFLGDIVKSMAHTFASFRWELNRTIKGGMWADPVEGGLTGVYFDYVNFYKKNSKLSNENKEIITEKFKNIRTNRDRFADDYIQWVMYEKDGVMRLNNVLREMFYRHIPFKKELRSKLEMMPAFAEIAVKHKNITSKAVQGYERRFKKYMEKDGVYPEKIQEFMDFLNS
ncbi:MAG: cyclic nucleotide-binding domain-containing protein [Spirochaetes bacterium]|nr:cyclic nucleotide-binding domain-containing protein [Spirochaetota bacterium]